ncbi:MAG: YihY/virulence factor BrkB family protein [Cytophagaceae bacterium]
MESRKKFRLKHTFQLLRSCYKEWIENDPFDLSAVVAYYSLLSLPALLIIIINVSGVVLGKQAVEGQISQEIQKVLGYEIAVVIENIIKNASLSRSSSLAAFAGIGTLLFGATGVFIALQKSLNKIWHVRIKPNCGIKVLLLNRLTSFFIILVMGLLILLFFLLTAALATFSAWIDDHVPHFIVLGLDIFNLLISFGLTMLLFGFIYKFLPDVKIPWSSIWLGAAFTSILFVLGKMVLGLYFSNINPASAYGAAGSLIIMMLWVSYSSLILFFGAQFTQVYASKYSIPVKYKKYTIRMADYYNEKLTRNC